MYKTEKEKTFSDIFRQEYDDLRRLYIPHIITIMGMGGMIYSDVAERGSPYFLVGLIFYSLGTVGKFTEQNRKEIQELNSKVSDLEKKLEGSK
ncbi:MAG: hypothetical protein HY363_01690 [Candidatus Aenigmarchaeota archaeon]|nr:hypothetical protein [Candidatus Aenigmarchaeota archaeon]